MNWNPNMKTAVLLLSILMTTSLSGVVSGQQKPATGYAPVNGLKTYYEIRGQGEPVVMLHGAFMAISKIPSADVIGYSLGGGVALNYAIRHPDKVRKVVSISAVFRQNGWTQEGLDALPNLTAEVFKGTPFEDDYKRLSPTPNEFPNFIKRVLSVDLKPHDFGADKIKATKAPMFFIYGDADGVRLDYIAEAFRLKGGEVHGDMRPRSASRLAILPDTTHVTLMDHWKTIVPMVNDFLDAKPSKQ